MQRRIICLLCILTIASGIHVCLAEQMEMDVWSVYLDEAENDEYIIDDPQYAWECVEINGIGYWRVSEMVKQIQFPLEIVGCPIIREDDGLALSSRNARLSNEQRQQALEISRTLFKSQEYAATHTVAETQKFVEDSIAASEGLELEYFELVDGTTLQKIASWDDTDYAVGCITVFCGDVRLIDNIKYKGL